MTFIEDTIYTDPSLRKETKSYWKMLKSSFHAIGKEQEEIDRIREVENTSHIPKRRLGELEFVDEFLKQLDV